MKYTKTFILQKKLKKEGIMNMARYKEVRFGQQLTEDEKELFNAVKRGNIDKAKELLDKGVNVNIRDQDSWTPLHFAAWEGYVDIAKLLLDHGANVNVVTNASWSPLYLAVYYEYVDIVKLLLEHGADVNAVTKVGKTPLHYAVSYGRADAVKLLLEYGADPNIKDGRGRIPIDIAKRKGYDDVARLLEEYSESRRPTAKHKRQSSKLDQILQKKLKKKGIMNMARYKEAINKDEIIVGRKYYIEGTVLPPSVRGPLKSIDELIPVVVVWKDLDSNKILVRYKDKDYSLTVNDLVSEV